jgi:hypothetical protein
MFIQKNIPNPFNKNSDNFDLAKKAELIKESLSFFVIFKNILFLALIGIVLVLHFKVSAEIILVFFGTEMLVNLIAFYLKVREFKAIYNIDAQDVAKSYRSLLITNEYWELIKSILGLIGKSISIAFILFFFSSEIAYISISNFINLPLNETSFRYLLFGFIAIQVINFILKLVRYIWIKNLKDFKDFAQVNQEYILIEKKLAMMKFIPTINVILLAFFLLGIPFWVLILFAALALIMVLLSIVEFNRIKNIKIENNEYVAPVVQNIAVNYQDEQITCAVFGVLKIASGFKDFFRITGYSYLGAGKNKDPENTLFVTNYRLILFYIPATGGDNISDNTDYVSQNFFFNRGEIRKNGEEILRTYTLSQIISNSRLQILFNEIKLIKLKQNKIIIEKNNGEKLAYMFMDKEYFESLKNSLNIMGIIPKTIVI